MINLKGIMGIPLLKKSRFTGSDGELRFVLEKQSSEERETGWRQSAGLESCAPLQRQMKKRSPGIFHLIKTDWSRLRYG